MDFMDERNIPIIVSVFGNGLDIDPGTYIVFYNESDTTTIFISSIELKEKTIHPRFLPQGGFGYIDKPSTINLDINNPIEEISLNDGTFYKYFDYSDGIENYIIYDY